jgi:cellulose synthase/poly-beta-1,6-N-acetylglucosamine synthase-like glycosyltransferase
MSLFCSFCVHMLVPCYKEPLDVVTATVNAALAATLPASTRRTVYLLDDGNSDDKRAFIEGLCNPNVCPCVRV